MFLRCTSTHSLVLRSIDSTDKINSDLCTVALARLTSHTGCTQALWRELGVRNGGCEVAYVSWECNSRFQVAPRVLGKRPDKQGYELASAGNWRLCPRHASFGSLMKAKKKKKKKKSAAMILIVTPPVARGVNLHAPHLRFLFAMHALSHVVPVPTQSANCSHPAHSQAATALRHISLWCACACLFS